MIAVIVIGAQSAVEKPVPTRFGRYGFYVEPYLTTPVLKITGYDINSYDYGSVCEKGKMMDIDIIEDDLALLTKWDTPSICNALEEIIPERRG